MLLLWSCRFAFIVLWYSASQIMSRVIGNTSVVLNLLSGGEIFLHSFPRWHSFSFFFFFWKGSYLLMWRSTLLVKWWQRLERTCSKTLIMHWGKHLKPCFVGGFVRGRITKTLIRVHFPCMLLLPCLLVCIVAPLSAAPVMPLIESPTSQSLAVHIYIGLWVCMSSLNSVWREWFKVGIFSRATCFCWDSARGAEL